MELLNVLWSFISGAFDLVGSAFVAISAMDVNVVFKLFLYLIVTGLFIGCILAPLVIGLKLVFWAAGLAIAVAPFVLAFYLLGASAHASKSADKPTPSEQSIPSIPKEPK